MGRVTFFGDAATVETEEEAGGYVGGEGETDEEGFEREGFYCG